MAYTLYMMMSEPMCCGEPMVHNSWTQEYECSAAYFRLTDDSAGEFVPEQATAEDVGPELAETLAHWRASRISNQLTHTP